MFSLLWSLLYSDVPLLRKIKVVKVLNGVDLCKHCSLTVDPDYLKRQCPKTATVKVFFKYINKTVQCRHNWSPPHLPYFGVYRITCVHNDRVRFNQDISHTCVACIFRLCKSLVLQCRGYFKKTNIKWWKDFTCRITSIFFLDNCQLQKWYIILISIC